MLMHHPELQREHEFQPSQVWVMELSGWVIGPLPPKRKKRVAVSSKATDPKETADG